MKRITDTLSIETWREIAEIIKETNVSKHTIDDFDINLKIIKDGVKDLDIYTDDIRLSTLLSSVYETKGFLNIPKIDFIEYIQKLELLGVKNIQFNPSMFPTTANKPIELVENGIYNNKCISKYYTDGKFKLYKPRVTFYRDNFRYNMVEIKDASFLIYTKISHEVPYALKEPIVLESSAVVKNFNGKLPSKDDVINCKYPKLNIHSRKINWEDSPVYSQIYKEFSHEEYEHEKRKVKNLTLKNPSE